MNHTSENSIVDQIRNLIKDAIEYFSSALHLLQARLADYALSSVLFIILIFFASLLGMAAFVFFNIALGFGLAKLTGSGLWSVLILGLFYALLAGLTGGAALRWLKNLKL